MYPFGRIGLTPQPQKKSPDRFIPPPIVQHFTDKVLYHRKREKHFGSGKNVFEDGKNVLEHENVFIINTVGVEIIEGLR